jgi:hypothetical protein
MTYPKRQYVRSKALMAAYRLIPCQHCGRDDGTVCGAHSNSAAHGKGRAIKADDNTCASLCHVCHAALDQGSYLSRDQRETMHAAAWRRTVRELHRRGLWPIEAPMPDVRVMQ